MKKTRGVYRIDGIRFTGERRELLKGLDAKQLLMDILEKRQKLQIINGAVSVRRKFGDVELEFTQTQMRSKMLIVKEIKEER